MSREAEINKQFLNSQSNVTSGDTGLEALEVIREEQVSQTASSVRMIPSKGASEDIKKDFTKCTCKNYVEAMKAGQQFKAEDLEKILDEKEKELRAEYDKILQREMAAVQEKFDLILVNEQIRTSYMLQEAQRDRQEKIRVLQTQLQCKNLAALMYVMCTEKRRSKLEKLRIIKEYTNYIHTLQDILTEGQELILYLSRGYKTAARVDQEWREKMQKIVKEFLTFIYNFAGGCPELNQYFIDLPKLLKTETPTVNDPNEDPCGDDGEEDTDQPVDETPAEPPWWEQLEEDSRPFVMFGDMAEFKPPQRRTVLKAVKAVKTAPKKWKKYVFNDMHLKNTCENVGKIKDLYPGRLPTPTKWGCDQTPLPNTLAADLSNQSLVITRCLTGQSIDIRGTMSSMLKIMLNLNANHRTSNNTAPVPTKTDLLGARDSMEISSATRLREKNNSKTEVHPEPKEVVLNIRRKRPSIFDAHKVLTAEDETPDTPETTLIKDDEEDDDSVSLLSRGTVAVDSLQAIHAHKPDVDHKIVYERICPMEKCQRMLVDSFVRTLPPYMRANPFIHFEQTFDQYETCSPEQLEMLKERIESKKHKEPEEVEVVEAPIQEWLNRGVAVQTSDMSLSLPSCTCHVPNASPVSSNFVFEFQDLAPVKLAMDAIHNECFFDDRIDFERFKLLGKESGEHLEKKTTKDFKPERYQEILHILKKHPSMLDIFQADAR